MRREIRVVREPFRLLRRWKTLRRAPRGDTTIMVLPGYSTGDLSTFALRRYLRSRGHRTRGWGLGTNRGNVGKNLSTVIEQVRRYHAEHGHQPLVLIGWSLGGVFAREVTRRHPDMVREIITLATPIWDRETHTTAASTFTDDPGRAEAIGRDARDRPVIVQRITAFFTKRDGVVRWQTCIDDVNPNVDHIEVNSSHAGILIDPDVWLEIAERLAD